MKNYREYTKEFIGESDIATLILAGINEKSNEFETKELHFGGDGCYRAWMVDEECEIPSHYTLHSEFKTWAKIYDDNDLAQNLKATKINIYRAEEMGVMIQLIK